MTREIEPGKTALVALVSDGTKLPVIYNYTQKADSPAVLSLIIPDKVKSPALTFASAHEIVVNEVVWGKPEEKRKEYSKRLGGTILDHLKKIGQPPYLVISAGLRWRLTAEFFNGLDPNRIINLHPGLLADKPDDDFVMVDGEKVATTPGLYGEDAFKEVLDRGIPYSGVTIHYMIERVDAGRVILRTAVPVIEGDNLQSLADRVHQEEDKALAEALDLLLVTNNRGLM